VVFFFFFFFFFFDMSTQEGEEEFELVTSASWGVVPNRLSYPLETFEKVLWWNIKVTIVLCLYECFVVRLFVNIFILKIKKQKINEHNFSP
jgi:hypothetical protein